MFIEQLYTGCISEFAYYIESDGEAAVIDPLRDFEVYLNLANNRNAKIKYIFESHFHADFVSGHLDLAKATGATIVYGPHTQTKYPVQVAEDNSIFTLGKVSIKLIHTPGHTLESSCFLLNDENGEGYSVFTGDTLFIGDVGRPDLSVQNEDLTTHLLAGMLYDSIYQKLVTLPENIIVYPGHGAGSNCGKNLSNERFSTIGNEKQTNYALKQASKEDFIKAIIADLTPAPAYFSINAQINKDGYSSYHSILNKGMTPLNIETFKELMTKDNLVLLDTRPAQFFVDGFIPNALFIGLEGRFAEWAASLIGFEKEIVLITEPEKEQETITRLTRVGFEKIIGYLDGGFDAWKSATLPIDLVIEVDVDELAMDIPFDDKLVVIDVRKETEFGNDHLNIAVNIPLETLTDPGSMADLDEDINIYVQCAGGYRSLIACSILKQQGIHNIRNIAGGWNAIQERKELFSFDKTEAVLN